MGSEIQVTTRLGRWYMQLDAEMCESPWRYDAVDAGVRRCDVYGKYKCAGEEGSFCRIR